MATGNFALSKNIFMLWKRKNQVEYKIEEVDALHCDLYVFPEMIRRRFIKTSKMFEPDLYEEYYPTDNDKFNLKITIAGNIDLEHNLKEIKKLLSERFENYDDDSSTIINTKIDDVCNLINDDVFQRLRIKIQTFTTWNLIIKNN